MLVSNGSGVPYSSGQESASTSSVSCMSVSTKPASSSAIPSSHLVAGVAPMKQNSPEQSTFSTDAPSGSLPCCVNSMDSSVSSPASPVTSVLVRIVTPGWASSLCTR
jgi:hypothetical protein